MSVDDIVSSAIESWRIAPAEQRFIESAKYLPNQLDRIQGVAFGSLETIVRDFRGGFLSDQEETLGFRLKSVDLVDGVLYAQGRSRHLRRRRRRLPFHLSPTEVTSGALYESWPGNRWFGNWLLNDCLTYRLAERYGTPVSSGPSPSGHAARYEDLLGMTPRRVGDVHFDELILFRDFSHNSDTKARADDYRRRLIEAVPYANHPGTFLLRQASGDRRVLVNERAIAEHLEKTRGFRVISPIALSVDEVVAACAGARVIVGVEGSQLAHGLMVMPPDAALLVIQPPKRVVSVLKATTDRQGQSFAFVVGTGGAEDFNVDQGDIDRTLDLLVP